MSAQFTGSDNAWGPNEDIYLLGGDLDPQEPTGRGVNGRH